MDSMTYLTYTQKSCESKDAFQQQLLAGRACTANYQCYSANCDADLGVCVGI